MISAYYFLLTTIHAIFFPRVFFSHFCSFTVVWKLGFGVGGVGLGFEDRGFQLMGFFWACGVGPSGLFGVGALYINIE